MICSFCFFLFCQQLVTGYFVESKIVCDSISMSCDYLFDGGILVSHVQSSHREESSCISRIVHNVWVGRWRKPNLRSDGQVVSGRLVHEGEFSRETSVRSAPRLCETCPPRHHGATAAFHHLRAELERAGALALAAVRRCRVTKLRTCRLEYLRADSVPAVQPRLVPRWVRQLCLRSIGRQLHGQQGSLLWPTVSHKYVDLC
jgi:hypothetical protein